MARASKLLIIYSNYYPQITHSLMQGASQVLQEADVSFDKIEVPGVLEIPAALAMAVKTKKYAGYIVLGCVIRGETTHYDIVANESTRAIMELVGKKCLALGNGIQTVENSDQAWSRANIHDKNKGGGAANAALEMIEVARKMKDIAGKK